MLSIEPYTIGIGDRFARQGRAQLEALVQAEAAGINVFPVWNKSHREHTLIKTKPADVRAEADAAVKALGWTGAYYVDADHISLNNVEGFISASNFFTVAYVGEPANESQLAQVLEVLKPIHNFNFTRDRSEHRDLLLGPDGGSDACAGT